MDTLLAREFRDRWRAVAAVEIEEQRAASVALRWQQLNSLIRLAMGLGLPLTRPDDQEYPVWQRWARLKDAQV